MNSLSWEIASNERRSQVKRFIKIAIIPLIVLVVINTFEPISNFYSWFLRYGLRSALNIFFILLIGVFIAVLIFYLINLLFPYKKRTYLLNDKGITISKGNKKRFFSWNKFETFYIYNNKYKRFSDTTHLNRENLFMVGESLEGNIFYLKKKSIKLIKVFIIVRAELDNSKQVLKFLSKYLPQKKMTQSTDLGLVLYRFK